MAPIEYNFDYTWKKQVKEFYVKIHTEDKIFTFKG